MLWPHTTGHPHLVLSLWLRAGWDGSAWVFFLPLRPIVATEEREELKNHQVPKTSHRSTWTENGFSKSFCFVHEQGVTCAFVWPASISFHSSPPSHQLPYASKSILVLSAQKYVCFCITRVPDSALTLHAWRLRLNCIVFFVQKKRAKVLQFWFWKQIETC